MVLAVGLVTFACQLFYNMALLQQARCKLQRDLGMPQDELFMNLAKLGLFTKTCGSSVVTLLQKPCSSPCAVSCSASAIGERGLMPTIAWP